MSVGLILNLLNELNKSSIMRAFGSIILFYSMISINLVMNLHKFNILFIQPKKELSIVKKDYFSPTHLQCNANVKHAFDTIFV